MKIISANYKTSAVAKNGLIHDDTPEICFVGRSNVGKSSLINNLVGIKRLAKTSSTPGLTKMVNYFDINGGAFRFVDLPGYGYAKVGKDQQNIWDGLMGEYLSSSTCLKMVFLLVDIRHTPSKLDEVMVSYLLHNALPFTIIATKADKLSRNAQTKAIKEIASTLSLREEMIFVHSSEKSLGREKLLEYIGTIME